MLILQNLYLRFANALVWLCVVYMIFCVYQAVMTPTDMNIMGVKVMNDNTVREEDPNHTIHVKHGEVMFVTLRVNARSTPGQNTVQRIIIDTASAQHVVSTVHRRWIVSKPQNVIADFPILPVIAKGCGATAYSQANYTFDYNLMTYIFPLVANSPSLKLCID